MSGKKQITPTEWVNHVLAELKDDSIDNHFDVFKDYRDLKGISLLEDACKILLEMNDVTTSNLNTSGYKPYISIPLGCHEAMTFWDPSTWDRLGEFNHDTPYEPPSCILSKMSILSDDPHLEVYHCPVALPPSILIAESKEILAMYCCFCTDQDMQEFQSRLYLYT